MSTKNIPLDTNGIPFAKPAFWLNQIEYRKIFAEINQIYDIYKDKQIAAHTSFGIDGKAYVYWFENHGFDDYNIYLRVEDNH